MKGIDCRMNLIKVTAHLCLNHQQSSDGQKMYTLLLSLVELQKIAYAPQSQRSPRSILRCYNQSFIFATTCIELFGGSRAGKSMFGMPFHCMVTHLPELLRLVSARSIVAEHAERHFNKLR